MDYSLFPDHKRFFKRYWHCDDDGYVYTDKLQFMVKDRTQIDGASQRHKKQGLVEWAEAFRASSWDEVNVIENRSVKEAAKTMQLIMSNPTEREMIHMRQDAHRDEITLTAEAERRGEERGEKRGADSKNREIAKRLKDRGYLLEEIMEITGLSAEEIGKH